MTVNDWLSMRVSLNIDQGYATSNVVSATKHGDYDEPVLIAMGTDPGTCANGTAPPIRFDGRRRSVKPVLSPRAVNHEGLGQLGLAAEYDNGEDPQGLFGGLMVRDLVGTDTATAKHIIAAALGKAGASYNLADLQDSGRLYGTRFENFIWHGGTKGLGLPPDVEALLAPQKAGESALSYIHRYDQIDAVATPLPGATRPFVPATSGGFYRTFESLAGRIYRVLIGGRPRSGPDTTLNPAGGAWPHIFTEGANILTGDISRDYPEADYVLVEGATVLPSYLSGLGVPIPINLPAHNWLETSTNDFMGARKVYDPNPPSSGMIEYSAYADSVTAGYGMDCQTVARARMLQVNRIIVRGSIDTPEDWLLGPGGTVRVQGAWSETGLQIGLYPNIQYPIGTIGAGQADRLLTGEDLWVQGVTYECSHGPNGAPVFTVTLNLLGGGLPDDTILPPPVQ